MKNINKKIIIVALVFFVLAILSVIFSIGINPAKEKDNNPINQENIKNIIEDKGDKIILDSPKPNQKIKSPVKVTGSARGSWFFEASFPIFIVDWDGKIIGTGVAQAKGDWMTNEFVPFEANISYELESNVYSKKGAIILKKDNPSGLPENDDALEIPIEFE